MSDQTSYQLRLALVNARVALQQNNKMEARRWALIAAKLAPENEEAWLILAAFSSPSASVAYLQKALRINPKSERAIKGMQWALDRLSRVQERADLGISKEEQYTAPVKVQPTPPFSVQPEITPIPIKETPVELTSEKKSEVEPPKRESREELLVESLRPEIPPAPVTKPISVKKPQPKKEKSFTWGVATIIILVLLSSAVVVWAAIPQWIALTHSYAAPIPGNLLGKPSLTPTFTLTPTVTLTPTPTETPTPTVTFTPTITNTPWPTSTPWPTNTPQPLPTTSSNEQTISNETYADTSGHWLEIDLGQQMLYAYDGDILVASFLVSTGTAAHPTVTGTYAVYVKYRYADMRGPGYYLPDVPYTMYFYQGYGIHGTYWHHNFGTPMSHGCVNMETSQAAWVYNFSVVGTPVIIHD